MMLNTLESSKSASGFDWSEPFSLSPLPVSLSGQSVFSLLHSLKTCCDLNLKKVKKKVAKHDY